MKLLHLDVEAAVFDLDGTLLDSERAICEAASAAFLDVGARVGELDVADHLGAPLEELFATFVHVEDDGLTLRRFIARYIERHDEHPDRFPPPLPGVLRGLELLEQRRVPCAVATTKPTARARAQLEGAGLLRFFGAIQGTDPGMKPKPAPDVVLRACAALGVAASRAVMVGDTPRDVGAARAAGAHAVVVAYSDARAPLAERMGADAVIRTLEQLCSPSDRLRITL